MKIILLGHETVITCKYLPTFRKVLLPISVGVSNKFFEILEDGGRAAK
jgi:hypothetical protein